MTISSMKKPIEISGNKKTVANKPLSRTKIQDTNNINKENTTNRRKPPVMPELSTTVIKMVEANALFVLPPKALDIYSTLFLEYYQYVINNCKIPAILELETVKLVIILLVNKVKRNKTFNTIPILIKAIVKPIKVEVADLHTIFRNMILKLSNHDKQDWHKLQATNNIEKSLLKLLSKKKHA